ncbi:MAG TPA: hypothetical protein VIL97_10085, partial [Thermoanaerobaculia bacterium]
PMASESLMKIYRLLILVVPLAVLALWIAYAFRSDRVERLRAACLGIFMLAGYAITYPRAAGATMHVIPILGAVGAIAWRLGAAPRNRMIRFACVGAMSGWLAFALFMMLLNPVKRLASDEWRFSRIPHCRGILIAESTDDELLRAAADVRRAVDGDEAFVQTMTAGFYYLAAGIRNPTPYDMPAATTFGPDGQKKLIAMIEEGRIEKVVAFNEPLGSQSPTELLRYVETTMSPVATTGRFTLYARR